MFYLFGRLDDLVFLMQKYVNAMNIARCNEQKT